MVPNILLKMEAVMDIVSPVSCKYELFQGLK